MGLTVSVFHFKPDGTIKRIPMTRWNRMCDEEEPYVGYEGQTIRIAYAYIDRVNRKPVYCPLIEGAIYRLDDKGMVRVTDRIRDVVSPLGDIDLGGELSGPSVIDACARFGRRRYAVRHTWKVTPKDVQALVDIIFTTL